MEDSSVFFQVIAYQVCFAEFSEAFATQCSKGCDEVLSIFVLFSGCNTIMVTEELKRIKKEMTARISGFIRLHLLVLLIINVKVLQGLSRTGLIVFLLNHHGAVLPRF